MSDEVDGGVESTAPVWAVFGDLMSVLLGAFVLILVGVIGVQLELSHRLDERSSSGRSRRSAARRWSRRWRRRWPRVA